ncbi:MAG: acetylornithine aminotransferase [Caeruleum heppii]|nr:MAG: acetylornithine aminotransferase [Caeruleum heppii]
MALRISSRRLWGTTRRKDAPSLVADRWKRYASAASAQAGSNLSEGMKQEISREASLPTADPPGDSQTAALVNGQLPYMVPTYVRPPPIFVKGEGCYLWDVENRRYLDFTAGIAVNALGHSDPEIAKLMYQQANTLIHTSNLYHNPWTGSLSKLLVSRTLSAGGMSTASKVFISNSGSEANEAALKFARKVGKVLDPSGAKHEILSFHNSFHGRTFGSLSATPNPKYQQPFAPMLPGFRYGTYNDVDAVETLITDMTCGVIVEPIQGEGGVNVASASFLAALRKRCNDVGAVLIYDEIQCGLSRTGTLWAHQAYPTSSHPDILTTAKALGNGFPIGATLVNEYVAEKIKTGDHGTTFGGNPLACRLGHHIFSRLSEESLQRDVLEKEKLFRALLTRLQSRYPEIMTEIRGRGLLLGAQLSVDPTPLVTAARERGLLIITCGTNTLRFVPPLVATSEEIEEGMSILAKAMAVVWGDGESVGHGQEVEGQRVGQTGLEGK